LDAKIPEKPGFPVRRKRQRTFSLPTFAALMETPTAERVPLRLPFEDGHDAGGAAEPPHPPRRTRTAAAEAAAVRSIPRTEQRAIS
jgi:hypothetical protein